MKKEDTRKSSNIALFDMDGTLCDYDGAMKRDLQLIASPEDNMDNIPWKDERQYIEARKNLIKRQPGWWKNIPRLETGFEILRIVLQYNFRILVLTKGPYNTPSAWSEKVNWCNDNLVNKSGIIITDNDETSGKDLVYGKILVDDWPPYIEEWLTRRPRGLVIMPAHSYNEHYKDNNVIRYDGSEEIKKETMVRVRLASLRT